MNLEQREGNGARFSSRVLIGLEARLVMLSDEERSTATR
jgi:hypothetical protein